MNTIAWFLTATLALGLSTALSAREGDEPAEEPAGIYCKLQSADLRDRLEELRADFLGAILEIDELDDGYRYWFAKSSERLQQLAKFVDFESQCCPFLNFEIGVASEAERVSLVLTGREGTKEYLRALAEASALD